MRWGPKGDPTLRVPRGYWSAVASSLGMSDTIDRLQAALADRYTIERELGAGGMATVYLAEDLKHDRKVAIKVLRPELAAVLGAERFVQEIKTTANLQHPHILPLFDSGQVEGFLYYVMPYVEGETLRNKLNRETQLGIEESVKITIEVADALDYAHRHNVIHRDIKPENILLHDGRPVVADFGIALAVSAAAGGRMTETGLSLGTPHYMSPEQATAEKQLSNRSDIYSLGAVLYEMLTGSPPHVGTSAQQIIMMIVTDEPRPVTELRKSVTPNVAAAATKALEKVPADRFASAAEFAAALTDPAFTLPTTGAAPSAERPVSGPQKSGTIAVLGVAAVLALVALWGWLRPVAGGGPTVYDVAVTSGGNMRVSDLTNFSVSADGASVVYESGGDGPLWIRNLLDDGTRPIIGTEGGGLPRISPDGQYVAFVTGGRLLQIVSLDGGAPRTLAETTTMAGLRWLADGQILLGDNDGQRFRWIDPQSGDVTERVSQYCILPAVVRDGALLCGGGGVKYAYLQSASGRTWLRVADRRASDSLAPKLRGSDFRIVDDRYLIYMSADGALRATSVDLERMQVGRSVTLVGGVRRESYTGAGQYDISPNGTLAYIPGANAEVGRLVVKRGDAEPEPLPIEPDPFVIFDLSPDGRRLAAVVEGVDAQELRIYELDSRRSRTWVSDHHILQPRWDPRGEELVFTVADLEGPPVTLRGSPNAATRPDTVTGVSGYLWVSHYRSDRDLFGWAPRAVAIDLTSDPVTVDTVIDEPVWAASLSPDGHWLAFSVGSAGGPLVLEPYPASGERFEVTTHGFEPMWLSERLLVYDALGTIHRVHIDPASARPVGTPQPWFSDPRFKQTAGPSYLVTPDGGVMYVQGIVENSASFLRVIPNWVDEMKRAVDDANR